MLIKQSNGLDSSKIILQSDVLIRSMSIFVGQSKAHQYAGNFEGVVHLSYERNRAALANKTAFFPNPSCKA